MGRRNVARVSLDLKVKRNLGTDNYTRTTTVSLEATRGQRELIMMANYFDCHYYLSGNTILPNPSSLGLGFEDGDVVAYLYNEEDVDDTDTPLVVSIPDMIKIKIKFDFDRIRNRIYNPHVIDINESVGYLEGAKNQLTPKPYGPGDAEYLTAFKNFFSYMEKKFPGLLVNSIPYDAFSRRKRNSLDDLFWGSNMPITKGMGRVLNAPKAFERGLGEGGTPKYNTGSSTKNRPHIVGGEAAILTRNGKGRHLVKLFPIKSEGLVLIDSHEMGVAALLADYETVFNKTVVDENGHFSVDLGRDDFVRIIHHASNMAWLEELRKKSMAE